jgi:hypothetical protein
MTQVAACQRCRKAIHVGQSESWCLGCGTPLGEEIESLLPRVVEMRAAAANALSQPRPVGTMSRGERILRGMVGMGAVFGAVGFAIFGAFSAKALLFSSRLEIGDDMDLILVAPFAAGGIAFGLGMFYAGLLALVARGRSFRELSIARVAAVGAAGGLAPEIVILASPLWGGTVTAGEVLFPLAFFPPLSAAVATATLLIARRFKPEAMPQPLDLPWN